MHASATVTSKGQVTIPASVREALGIRRGATLLFHVNDDQVVIEERESGRRAVVRLAPDFFDLAGSVPVPSELSGASWPAIRRRAREHRVRRGE